MKPEQNNMNDFERNPLELSEGIKFTFSHGKKEKLIIEAYIYKEKSTYVGELEPSSYVDFDLIKEMIEENQYNVLIKNEEMLKIKVGPVKVELSIKPKTESQLLKEEIEKLTEQKAEIESKIEELKAKCQNLSNPANSNPSSSQEEIIPLKWSEELKSEKNIVNGSITTKKTSSFFNEFTLTEKGFSKDMKKKQTWAIKCLMEEKKERLGLYVGICLRKGIQSDKFVSELFKERNIGHEMYLIGSNGLTFSRQEEKINNKKKNFKYSQGDVVYIEYDPIKWRLRFRLNKHGERFEMPILPPPEDDEYHPCVALHWAGLSGELISPGENLS